MGDQPAGIIRGARWRRQPGAVQRTELLHGGRFAAAQPPQRVEDISVKTAPVRIGVYLKAGVDLTAFRCDQRGYRDLCEEADPAAIGVLRVVAGDDPVGALAAALGVDDAARIDGEVKRAVGDKVRRGAEVRRGSAIEFVGVDAAVSRSAMKTVPLAALPSAGLISDAPGTTGAELAPPPPPCPPCIHHRWRPRRPRSRCPCCPGPEAATSKPKERRKTPPPAYTLTRLLPLSTT